MGNYLVSLGCAFAAGLTLDGAIKGSKSMKWCAAFNVALCAANATFAWWAK